MRLVIEEEVIVELYDAIAEGRTREALEIVYDLDPENLVHPHTQMRLAELRPRQ